MIQKIIISLIFIMSLTTTVSAQESETYEIENLGSEIFSFLNSLNDNINSFFEEEDRKRVYRQLGYLQSDLRRYLIERKKLMNYLEENNYQVDDREARKMVDNLKSKLDKLSERLWKVSVYVDSNLSYEAEDIVNRIHQPQQQQSAIYLTQLDKFLDGQPIDTENLTKEGQRIYTNLENSVELISQIRERIKT